MKLRLPTNAQQENNHQDLIVWFGVLAGCVGIVMLGFTALCCYQYRQRRQYGGQATFLDGVKETRCQSLMFALKKTPAACCAFTGATLGLVAELMGSS